MWVCVCVSSRAGEGVSDEMKAALEIVIEKGIKYIRTKGGSVKFIVFRSMWKRHCIRDFLLPRRVHATAQETHVVPTSAYVCSLDCTFSRLMRYAYAPAECAVNVRN